MLEPMNRGIVRALLALTLLPGAFLIASVPAHSLSGATKATCTNAWWDKEFAGVIPQFKRKQSVALTNKIWQWCHENHKKVMTSAQRDKIYEGFFLQVGKLVADEVTRVSNAKNLGACAAGHDVMKPSYASGFGLTGWDKTSFLSILYKQWQGGPIIGKIGSTECDDPNQYMMFQFRRHYLGRHEGPYQPPLGTKDATWPITNRQMSASWVKSAVCVVWHPSLNNAQPGGRAVVTSYTYTNMGDGINFVAADNEVGQCLYRAQRSAGIKVDWPAQASLTTLRDVSEDFAGVWHNMASNCSWRLQPADGSAEVTWRPQDGSYMTVQLQPGDKFGSTCALYKRNFEHMIVAPDGMFPLESVVMGARQPTTPATCRYAFAGPDALRNPPRGDALMAYAGQPVDLWRDGVLNGKPYLRSVGCGYWRSANS